MNGPETTQDIATHLRRMADNAGDQIDAERLSIAANLVDRAHLVAPDLPSDGGPAFPSDMLINGSVKGSKPYCGMSLRDWFAGQALAAWPVTDRGGTATDLARKCYTLADAMIAAREAKP